MHKCWEVPELLTAIFLHTTDDPNPTRDQYSTWPIPGSSTLALLARTCKPFSEPALDILWRFMPGLGPLTRCLPSDAVETIPKQKTSPSYVGGKIVRDSTLLNAQQAHIPGPHSELQEISNLQTSSECIFTLTGSKYLAYRCLRTHALVKIYLTLLSFLFCGHAARVTLPFSPTSLLRLFHYRGLIIKPCIRALFLDRDLGQLPSLLNMTLPVGTCLLMHGIM